jgi:hypothetical protein
MGVNRGLQITDKHGLTSSFGAYASDSGLRPVPMSILGGNITLPANRGRLTTQYDYQTRSIVFEQVQFPIMQSVF